MYEVVMQSSSSDSNMGLGCLTILVMVAIAWAVLAKLASMSKQAMPSTQVITSSLARERIVQLVLEAFPKSKVVSDFSWEPAWPTSERLTVSGQYLTDGQGCLVMLLMGIIPGLLMIRFAMGKTERVSVDFSSFQATGQLSLEASGLRAQKEIGKLVTRLNDHGASVAVPA